MNHCSRGGAFPEGGSTKNYYIDIWGFPKIRGTLLGVPIIRTIVFWGLYWGPPILGNYHMCMYTLSLRLKVAKKLVMVWPKVLTFES